MIPPVTVRVVGIDPGPVPGLVLLEYNDLTATRPYRVEVVQCTHGIAPAALVALLNGRHATVGIERFVVSRRSGRSAAAQAGEVTRDLIGQLTLVISELGTLGAIHARSAGEVKPWATDERLEAAGLLEATKGMRHAKDAARHALFTAVRDAGARDPLSKTATAAV